MAGRGTSQTVGSNDRRRCGRCSGRSCVARRGAGTECVALCNGIAAGGRCSRAGRKRFATKATAARARTRSAPCRRLRCRGVAHPGVYVLPKTARGSDAVHAAGGPSRAADLVPVNLAAPIEDGAEIIVPSKGSAAADDAVTVLQTADAASQRPPRRRSTHHRKRRAHHAAVSAAYAPDGPNASDGAGMAPTLISLNTADVTALEALPGIGAALAARVVAFRDANGPFASLDELLDVNGITQAKLDALTPLVRL